MASNLVVFGECCIAHLNIGYSAHELVCHDVLKVINDDDVLAGAIHRAHDFATAIAHVHRPWLIFGDGLPVIRSERKGLLDRLYQQHVLCFEVAKAGCLARAGFPDDHGCDAHGSEWCGLIGLRPRALECFSRSERVPVDAVEVDRQQHVAHL